MRTALTLIVVLMTLGCFALRAESYSECRDRMLRESGLAESRSLLVSQLAALRAELTHLQTLQNNRQQALSDVAQNLGHVYDPNHRDPKAVRQERIDSLQEKVLSATRDLAEFDLAASSRVAGACLNVSEDVAAATRPQVAMKGEAPKGPLFQELKWSEFLRRLIRDKQFNIARGVVLFGDQSYDSIEEAAKTIMLLADVEDSDSRDAQLAERRIVLFLRENCASFSSCRDVSYSGTPRE